MTKKLIAAVLVSGCSLVSTSASAGPPTETLRTPGFGQVWVYAPPSTPEQVVLFISGDGGWNLGVIPMAEALRDRGALVVGIDIRAFIRTLDSGDGCSYPAGALEQLSRTVQLHRKLAKYRTPILVGYSSGATLVYAALAGSPPETFAGAISLGFCPDLEITRPLCRQNGLVVTRRANGKGYDVTPNHRLALPWMILQGENDQVCSAATTRAFATAIPAARFFSLAKVGHGFAVPRNWESQYLAAYAALTTRRPSVPPTTPAPDIDDLDLEEVPVAAEARTDTMAIILTGDGGWAELDKALAAGFAANGIPSIGWSSLQYYWKPRTADGAAADLARIATHYLSAWNVSRIILVGYSFGADVMPFLVNRLPTSMSERIRSVALLGPSGTAEFQFHLADWFGRKGSSVFQTVPEAQRLQVPVICVRGADEHDSPCARLQGPHFAQFEVGRGHHFGGDYSRVVSVILNTLR